MGNNVSNARLPTPSHQQPSSECACCDQCAAERVTVSRKSCTAVEHSGQSVPRTTHSSHRSRGRSTSLAQLGRLPGHHAAAVSALLDTENSHNTQHGADHQETSRHGMPTSPASNMAYGHFMYGTVAAASADKLRVMSTSDGEPSAPPSPTRMQPSQHHHLATQHNHTASIDVSPTLVPTHVDSSTAPLHSARSSLDRETATIYSCSASSRNSCCGSSVYSGTRSVSNLVGRARRMRRSISSRFSIRAQSDDEYDNEDGEGSDHEKSRPKSPKRNGNYYYRTPDNGSFPLDAASTYAWRRSMDAASHRRYGADPSSSARSFRMLRGDTLIGRVSSRSKSVDIPSEQRSQERMQWRSRSPLDVLRRKRYRTPSGAFKPTHRYMLGRRYHNTRGAPYCLPNDATEADRLDQEHYVLRALFGRNYLAPISHPGCALEIGAGTGTWQLEMAAEFPETEFVGIDIAPSQPASCLPVNCHFEMADMLQGLPFSDQRFDYVHHRMLSLGVPADQWPLLIAEQARVCRVGGWLELLETDWEPRDGGEGATRFNGYLKQLYAAQNIDPSQTLDLVPHLTRSGISDVRRLVVQLPLGGWGGDIGVQAQQVVLGAWQALRGPMLARNVTTSDQLDETFAMLETEMSEHPMWLSLVVYIGRRQ